MIESAVIMGEGVVGLVDSEYGQQVWASCKTRKHHVCIITRLGIKKGGMAYRPITNKGNRMKRISMAGMSIVMDRFR